MMRVLAASIWTGIGLIVAVNALVQGGVAYNRSGTPEATLRLTQRELAAPDDWGLAHENSGLALRLMHRTAGPPPRAPGADPDSAYAFGPPHWLDEAKLTALGVDVGKLVGPAAPGRGGAPTAREALLVLEFDGPAHADALAQARRRAAEEANLALANPGKEEFAKRAEKATDAARREETESSRLFVVDAGLDRDELRARYTDRERYAIVRAIIQPVRLRNGKPGAYIRRLAIGEISVPGALRAALAAPIAADRARAAARPQAKYEATVSWGKRLEPWIATAHTP